MVPVWPMGGPDGGHMSTEMTRSVGLPSNLAAAMEFAKNIANTALVPDAFRGKPAELLAVMVYGDELGMTPLRAIRSFNIISGQPSLKAEAKAAMVMSSPLCEYFTLVESTPDVARYTTKRRGAPVPVDMAYTMAEARSANLTGKQVWKSHPAAMLRARCSAALALAVYPDLVGGVYTDDEVEEIVAERRGSTRVEQRTERPRATAAASAAKRAEMMRRGSAPPVAGVVEDAEVVRTGVDRLLATLADFGIRRTDFDEWAANDGRSVVATMDSKEAEQAAWWLANKGGADVVKQWHADRAAAPSDGPDSPPPDKLQAALEAEGVNMEHADAFAEYLGIKPASAAGARDLWLAIMHGGEADEFGRFCYEREKAAAPKDGDSW